MSSRTNGAQIKAYAHGVHDDGIHLLARIAWLARPRERAPCHRRGHGQAVIRGYSPSVAGFRAITALPPRGRSRTLAVFPVERAFCHFNSRAKVTPGVSLSLSPWRE